MSSASLDVPDFSDTDASATASTLWLDTVAICDLSIVTDTLNLMNDFAQMCGTLSTLRTGLVKLATLEKSYFKITEDRMLAAPLCKLSFRHFILQDPQADLHNTTCFGDSSFGNRHTFADGPWYEIDCTVHAKREPRPGSCHSRRVWLLCFLSALCARSASVGRWAQSQVHKSKFLASKVSSSRGSSFRSEVSGKLQSCHNHARRQPSSGAIRNGSCSAANPRQQGSGRHGDADLAVFRLSLKSLRLRKQIAFRAPDPSPSIRHQP